MVRKITFDKRNGAKQLGIRNPYEGIGALTTEVTRLKAPDDALFVEYHIIYNEPQGWFNGGPVLDGKVRMMIDNDVKSFRKDLKSASGPVSGPSRKTASVSRPSSNGPAAAGSASKK